MGVWQWLGNGVAAALSLIIVLGIALFTRRRLLSRGGGTFDLAVRVGGTGRTDGGGWRIGVGRYRGDTLQWYRVFTLSVRPRHTWERDHMDIIRQREPEIAETATLYAGEMIAVCHTDADDVELAMAPSSFMGFSSWLEAGPPGTDWTRRPSR